jgi:hypothetical protein
MQFIILNGRVAVSHLSTIRRSHLTDHRQVAAAALR